MTLSRLAAIVLVLLFLPVIIFARDIEIYVEDEDIQMPLEGATVIIRGGNQFICDEDGIARVTLPDDRPTVVSITYPGYEPFRLTIPGLTNPTVGSGNERFNAALRLGGVMTGQELVVEASRPEASETRSGRSVAISDRELARTAEIGIIEDVMNSVKLLPGVGYTGMFSAMPSIRGGDPGDLMAALDGFYLERPYHWLGSVSIFDPKMVSSAQLSHGVFSSRYGHTISGLLEVTSKSPSNTETELEAAIGSSAASLNLSIPLSGKGGILFMGKVTYWDTLVLAAQGLSRVIEDETLAMINSVSTSPYIRSAAISVNYRFTPDMDWRLNAFFGSDGVGADFKTDYDDDEVKGRMEMTADYANYQGFLITGLTLSPNPILALRFTGGIGFMQTATEDYVDNNITASYNEDFLNLIPDDAKPFLIKGPTYTAPNVNAGIKMESTVFNAQARADADIDLGQGFIAAFGIQELYSQWKQSTDVNLSFIELPIANLPPEYIDQLPPALSAFLQPLQNLGIPNLTIIMPRNFKSDVLNHGLTTSAYGLLEYTSPTQFFGAELGLRIDHLFFKGKNFDAQTKPAFNPRLNLDFNILKNRGNLDSFSATIGTGLFSSINSLLCFFDPDQFDLGQITSMGNIEMKLNRSWTSVVGFKFDFFQKYSFNIEGYFKYVFDRAYITADILSSDGITPSFNFDGVGHVWGFDLQLQKMESRYLDGWISYTFTWAKYNDPLGGGEGVSMGSVDTNEQWYYPSFHRFHNANIVLNIKPLTWFNIAVRFGFASGQPRRKVSDVIEPYPVLVMNEEGEAVLVQKYRRVELPDDEKGIERSAWSLPLDVKFSFFPVNRNGRASLEIYLAGENLLAPIYRPAGNTTFNDYTGKEDPGGGSGNFDLPIPMISFGFKWRY
jgi:hypothetical protein